MYKLKFLISDLTKLVTHYHTELASLDIHWNKSTKLGMNARAVLHNLNIFRINSSVRINSSLDISLNNHQSFNIIRPAVRRKYCDTGVDIIQSRERFVSFYTYVFDSGTWSVGMDPENLATRKMTTEMDSIATVLQNLLKSKRNSFNFDNVCLDKNSTTALLPHITLNMTWNKAHQ